MAARFARLYLMRPFELQYFKVTGRSRYWGYFITFMLSGQSIGTVDPARLGTSSASEYTYRMSKIGVTEVERVAKLARIGLSAEEAAKLSVELCQIVAFVEQLQAVDVEGVEPT